MFVRTIHYSRLSDCLTSGPRDTSGHTGNSGSSRVVSVDGDIDASSLPDFVAVLEDSVEDESGAVVIVDLTGVTFLSIRGAQALDRARANAATVGREMLLVPGPECVHRALCVTELSDHFEPYRTVQSAVDESRRRRVG